MAQESDKKWYKKLSTVRKLPVYEEEGSLWDKYIIIMHLCIIILYKQIIVKITAILTGFKCLRFIFKRLSYKTHIENPLYLDIINIKAYNSIKIRNKENLFNRCPHNEHFIKIFLLF